MKAHLVEICSRERCQDVLGSRSTWQWAAGHRSAAQGLSVVCSGGGSVVVVLVAFTVEFRTSPKSPPAGLAPPTLDFKFSTFSSNDLKVGEFLIAGMLIEC